MRTVLEWIAGGPELASLRSNSAACRRFNLNEKEFWTAIASDEWSQEYARAIERRGLSLAERMHDIAEETVRGDVDPAAARVAIDAFKWTSARMAPRKLGDRIDVTSGDKPLAAPVTNVVFRVGRDVVDRVESEHPDHDADGDGE